MGFCRARSPPDRRPFFPPSPEPSPDPGELPAAPLPRPSGGSGVPWPAPGGASELELFASVAPFSSSSVCSFGLVLVSSFAPTSVEPLDGPSSFCLRWAEEVEKRDLEEALGPGRIAQCLVEMYRGRSGTVAEWRRVIDGPWMKSSYLGEHLTGSRRDAQCRSSIVGKG